MEKIIIYRANDGEEFDTKTDCEEYENSLNIAKNKDIILLDRVFEKITSDSIHALNDAMYLFFKNHDSVLTYNKCASYFGYTTVCDGDSEMWFKYNNGLDLWESIDGKIEQLTNLKTKLSKVSEEEI